MIVVVPPSAAARVPEAKSSETRTAPTGSCMWVWGSTPPGRTSLPVASWTFSPGRGVSPAATSATRPSSPTRRSAGRPPTSSITVPPQINMVSTPCVTAPAAIGRLRRVWGRESLTTTASRRAAPGGVGGREVDAHEVPVDDDGLAGDEEVADTAVGTEHEAVDRVREVGQVVERPDGEVGRRPHLEPSEVASSEAGGAPRGGERQRLGGRQGVGASLAQAGRGRGPGAAPAAGRPSRSRRGRRRRARRGRRRRGGPVPGTCPAARRAFELGQCATPVPAAADGGDLVGVEVDGVGEPDVVAEPVELLHQLQRSPAEACHAVARLVVGLGEVGVQAQSQAAGRARRTPA